MKKNENISLEITDLTISGSGVGHADGMAVFVPCTAVGDKISAHIVKVKKTMAFGKVSEIIASSPDRIENDCPAYPRCGGCVFRHISYEAELRLKEQQVKENFKRIGGMEIPIEPIIGADNIREYRNKAQYPVSLEKGELKIGFYAQRSHRVIDCRSCALQPKAFEGIVEVFANWIEKYKVPIYNELDSKGLLRHIYIRRAHATGEIMVCAVVKKDKLPHENELIDALINENKDIKIIIINVNPDDTNVILGEKCRVAYGESHITDILCSKKIRISPLSFYQVNSAQTEKLYAKAAEFAQLDKDTKLLDLYCGAGTIGLSMADKVKELTGVEIIPEAVQDAKINAEANGVENARFICADASQAAEMLKREGSLPDVVVLDPPRKGCERELIETVVSMAPKRIVYVSCDSATLARDCAVFAQLGYTPQKATPVDMFPRTGHVECVTLLTRSAI